MESGCEVIFAFRMACFLSHLGGWTHSAFWGCETGFYSFLLLINVFMALCVFLSVG